MWLHGDTTPFSRVSSSPRSPCCAVIPTASNAISRASDETTCTSHSNIMDALPRSLARRTHGHCTPHSTPMHENYHHEPLSHAFSVKIRGHMRDFFRERKCAREQGDVTRYLRTAYAVCSIRSFLSRENTLPVTCTRSDGTSSERLRRATDTSMPSARVTAE